MTLEGFIPHPLPSLLANSLHHDRAPSGVHRDRRAAEADRGGRGSCATGASLRIVAADGGTHQCQRGEESEPKSAHGHPCLSLVKRPPRWRRCVNHVHSLVRPGGWGCLKPASWRTIISKTCRPHKLQSLAQTVQAHSSRHTPCAVFGKTAHGVCLLLCACHFSVNNTLSPCGRRPTIPGPIEGGVM